MNRNGIRILAIAVAAFLLLVIQFASPSHGGLWMQSFYDSLHVPSFGIIAVCVLFVTPQHWSRSKRLLVTLATIAVLSALSEIAQIPTSRDASFADLLSDWFGAAGFVAIAVVFSSSISVPKGRGRYLLVLGIALVVWPLIPLLNVSAAYLERSNTLPALASFDSKYGNVFFHAQNATVTKIDSAGYNSLSAEVALKDAPWPGIIFHEPWPNWAPYTAFVVDIENPDSAALKVEFRISDEIHRDGNQAYGDRFNRVIVLAPGKQSVRIPLSEIQSAPKGREMDLAKIDAFALFCSQEEAGRRFVLHDIRLE